MWDQHPNIKRPYRAAQASKWMAIIGVLILSILVAMFVPPPKDCQPITIAGSILLAGCQR